MAHANSGYLLSAHVGLGPSVELAIIDEQMTAVGDFQKDQSVSAASWAMIANRIQFYVESDSFPVNEIALHNKLAPLGFFNGAKK